MTFVSNWLFIGHSAIVPGGWSIAAEMNMYCLLPFLSQRITSWKSGIIWLLFSIVLGSALSILGYVLFVGRTTPPELVKSFFNSYWLPTCLPSFIAGIVAFRFWNNSLFSKGMAAILLLASLFLSVAVAYSPLNLKAIIYAPIFGALVLATGVILRNISLHPGICWLGKISYSAYFAHFVVLHMIQNMMPNLVASLRSEFLGSFIAILAVICITSILSSATFLFFEKPFIRIGADICRRMQRHYN